MLSVTEAKGLLFSQVKSSAPVPVKIAEAYGNVLGKDVFAPINMPVFDASSVDGYALCFQKIEDHSSFEIKGEIKAGDAGEIILQPGQCVCIFTGAMVPDNATLVVMQEDVRTDGSRLTLNEDFNPRNFIRRKGTQIKKGEFALGKGSFLNPGAVGFLASMGIAEIMVYKKPAVSVIVTGNELVEPGNNLAPGKIYESNSFALIAALDQQHLKPVHVLKAADIRENLDAQLSVALNDSDVVLLSGGISVGKYDLVYNALMDAGAETVFYKVAQRPGKPLWAGKLGEKLIFALPGNPASVMACFYEYVYPALRIIRGFPDPFMHVRHLKLLKEIYNPGDRASFIRAKLVDDGVLPLDKQDSGMMISFAGGNGLIYIPQDRKLVAENEIVEVHLLPFDE